MASSGVDSSQLEHLKGYWILTNEAGNLSLPGVGGSYENATYEWSRLRFWNGSGEVNVTDAFSSTYGWLSNSNKITYWDVEEGDFRYVCNKLLLPGGSEFCSPTSVTNLADMIKYVCDREVEGVYHAAGAERISRYYFGIKIAEIFNLDKTLIVPYKSEDSLRPKDCSLDIRHSKSIIKVPFFNINRGLSHMRKSKRSIYYKIL